MPKKQTQISTIMAELGFDNAKITDGKNLLAQTRSAFDLSIIKLKLIILLAAFIKTDVQSYGRVSCTVCVFQTIGNGCGQLVCKWNCETIGADVLGSKNGDKILNNEQFSVLHPTPDKGCHFQ